MCSHLTHAVLQIVYGSVFIRLSGHQRSSVLPADGLLLFRRVNNAFIHQLRISFCPENLPVPQYLRANAGKLHCQIGVLIIDGIEDEVLIYLWGTSLRCNTGVNKGPLRLINSL